jgi:hypothetical protein
VGQFDKQASSSRVCEGSRVNVARSCPAILEDVWLLNRRLSSVVGRYASRKVKEFGTNVQSTAHWQTIALAIPNSKELTMKKTLILWVAAALLALTVTPTILMADGNPTVPPGKGWVTIARK